MKASKPKSIFLTGFSWPIFHGLASFFLFSILAIQLTDLSTYIETRITAPILFQVRDKLGRTPPITPRLKIIALDDSTFSFLGGPRPSTDDLRLILEHIGARQPQAILIDSLLSDRPFDANEKTLVTDGAFPIYSGNFPSSTELKYRVPIDLEAPAYQTKTYLDKGLDYSTLTYHLADKHGWNMYGFSNTYHNLIRSTGHITYNLDGTISPFYQLNEDKVIPHLGLYAADSILLRKDGLYINDRKVPLTRNGTTVINHRPPQLFYDRATPLRTVLQRARDGVPETQVEKGDIVLLLLAFATGNTDFHEGGPFGEIPGGLMIGSLISDLQLGSWLSRWEGDVALILIFGVAGIILGINSRVRQYWSALIGLWVVCSVCVFLSFAYANLWLPWLLPLAAFTGTSLIQFAHVRIQDEMKLIMIEKNYYEEKALRLEEMQKKAELETNLAVGKTVQELLLPKALDGNFFGHHYQMKYKPVSKLSGDWLYAWDFSLAERRLLIGDVMGTGPSAAIPMALIVGILKDCEEQRLTLEDSIIRLNQRLFELFDQHVICSLSAVVMHRDGRIDLYNAGGPGWFVTGPRQPEFLVLKSSPIGLNANTELARMSLQLSEHQAIFTFTDGYFKTTKDLKRLIRAMRQIENNTPTVEDIEKLLLSSLQVGQATDDQSLLCIVRDKSQKSKTAA